MGNYHCPICGLEIMPDQVLFVDKSSDKRYLDVRRYNDLVGRFKEFPLEDMRNFQGLYYHATMDNTCTLDANEFPTVVEVKVSDGLTPLELELERLPEDREELPDVLPIEEKPTPSKAPIKLGDRACPHCHCSLPKKFGMLPTICVTMLGGRAAGKTAYLIALLQQLQTQLSQFNLGTVSLLPESEAFMQLQINYYVEHGGITMPTPTERLFPLVMEYNYNNGEETHACYFALYDIAGEAVQNRENRANTRYLLNHPGIQDAQVVLLVLDPNQLNNGAFKAMENRKQQQAAGEDTLVQPYGKPTDEQHDPHDFYGTSIPVFLNNAITANRDLGILSNVRHVITLVTKIDQPLMFEPSLFDTPNVMIKNDIGNLHNKRVNEVVLRRVESDLLLYFGHKLNRDLKKVIACAFAKPSGESPNVNLLAVSTYTLNRSPDNLISFQNDFHETARKHRIIEPFLALLAISNMVPIAAPAPERAEARQPAKPSRWRGRR